MSVRSLSCALRIKGELDDAEQAYTRLWRRPDEVDASADDDERDDVYAELIPLGLDVVPIVKVRLSWGGPSDWLEIELRDDRHPDIRRVTYHSADWFSHAEQDLSEEEAAALWHAAEYYTEGARQSFAAQLGRTR